MAKAATAHPKPEPAIVPSKRKRGALADITIPNQTTKVTKIDMDSDPKHSNHSRHTMNKNQVQPKSIKTNFPKHTKVINIYRERSTTIRTASHRLASQEQRLVKDAITVVLSTPERDNILPAPRSEAGVGDPTGPVQPSQEGETVHEAGQQEPEGKRRKLSEESVEDQTVVHGSNLRPCSKNPIRAEDGRPDDLDEEDAIDPGMEPEYQAECYQYMRELEVSGNYF